MFRKNQVSHFNRLVGRSSLGRFKIHMLLGNNIMKPLGAEITLFSTGNGKLKIKEEEIDLKETTKAKEWQEQTRS